MYIVQVFVNKDIGDAARDCVGTWWDSNAFWCPSKPGLQPYRQAANPWKLFRKTVAAAVIGEALRSHIIARKNLVLPHEKKRAAVLPSVRRNEIA
jgi:hypothetical protein